MLTFYSPMELENWFNCKKGMDYPMLSLNDDWFVIFLTSSFAQAFLSSTHAQVY